MSILADDGFETRACISCSIRFRVPVGFTADRRRDKRTFWCPNGHQMSYRESEADRLRRDLDRAKQNTAYLEDAVREARDGQQRAERSAAAARGQVTKLKKRAANGVCPCCNRSFSDLRRHMESKHPEFMAEEIAS